MHHVRNRDADRLLHACRKNTVLEEVFVVFDRRRASLYLADLCCAGSSYPHILQVLAIELNHLPPSLLLVTSLRLFSALQSLNLPRLRPLLVDAHRLASLASPAYSS